MLQDQTVRSPVGTFLFPPLTGHGGLGIPPAISSQSLQTRSDRLRGTDELRQSTDRAADRAGRLCKLLLQDEADYIPFWI